MSNNVLEEKLFLALDNEDVATVQKILKKNCSPNVTDEDSFSPLIIASAIGNLELISMLVKAKADVSYNGKDGSTALLCAVQEGFVDIAKYLLKSGAQADENHTTSSLYSAAQEGHFKLAKMLIRAKANPNRASKGVCPLFIAAQEGHFKVVRLLLTAQANPDKPNLGGISPLQIAMQMGRSDIINMLIAAKADIKTENENNRTPLMLAIEEGDLLAVEALIKAKVDLDEANSKGVKPLILAAQYGDIDMIEQMVTHGINLSAVDDAGQDARAIVKAKFDEDISHILNSEAGGAEAKQLSSKENTDRRMQRKFLKYAGEDKSVSRTRLEAFFVDQGYDINSRRLGKKVKKVMAKYADAQEQIDENSFAEIYRKVLRRQEKEKEKQKNRRTSKAKAAQPRSDPAEPEKAMANPFASAAKKLFRQKKNAPAKMYPAQSSSKSSSSLPQTAQYKSQRQRSTSMYKNNSTGLKHHSSYSPMDGAYSKLDGAYSTLDGASGTAPLYGHPVRSSVALMARHEIQAMIQQTNKRTTGRQLFNRAMEDKASKASFEVGRRASHLRQKLPGIDVSPRGSAV